MPLTREQLINNIHALEQQGASQEDIQGYINSAGAPGAGGPAVPGMERLGGQAPSIAQPPNVIQHPSASQALQRNHPVADVLLREQLSAPPLAPAGMSLENSVVDPAVSAITEPVGRAASAVYSKVLTPVGHTISTAAKGAAKGGWKELTEGNSLFGVPKLALAPIRGAVREFKAAKIPEEIPEEIPGYLADQPKLASKAALRSPGGVGGGSVGGTRGFKIPGMGGPPETAPDVETVPETPTPKPYRSSKDPWVGKGSGVEGGGPGGTQGPKQVGMEGPTIPEETPEPTNYVVDKTTLKQKGGGLPNTRGGLRTSRPVGMGGPRRAADPAGDEDLEDLDQVNPSPMTVPGAPGVTKTGPPPTISNTIGRSVYPIYEKQLIKNATKHDADVAKAFHDQNFTHDQVGDPEQIPDDVINKVSVSTGHPPYTGSIINGKGMSRPVNDSVTSQGEAVTGGRTGIVEQMKKLAEARQGPQNTPLPPEEPEQ